MDKSILIPTPDQYQDWRSFAEAVAESLELMKSSPGAGTPIILLADRKPLGTHGGTFDSGAWRVRELNTEDDAMGVCILNANVFRIPRGRYLFRASAPGNQVGTHQARLWNVTRGEVVLWGTSESGGNLTTRSMVIGPFVLREESELRLEHRCQNSRATDGFGVAGGFGTEVYSSVSIQGVE